MMENNPTTNLFEYRGRDSFGDILEPTNMEDYELSSRLMDDNQFAKIKPYELVKDDIYRLNDRKIVKHLKDMGYVYDFVTELWFKIDRKKGIFVPLAKCSDDEIRNEIYQTVARFEPEQPILTTQMVTHIISYLRGISNNETMDADFNKFIVKDAGNLFDCQEGDLFIPVQNGLVHFNDGRLYAHCGLRFTNRVFGVDYTPIHDFNDVWEHDCKYLFENVIPDESVLRYLIWWVGMVVFGNTPADVMLTIYGRGGTGKSSLVNAIVELIGDDYVSHLSLSQFNQPSATATLVGKKLNVSVETDLDYDGKDRSRGSIFKNLTGGDKITANPKHKAMFTFENTANVLLVGNAYPDFDTTDSGIQRRARVIVCNEKQKGDKDAGNLMKSPEYVNWLFNASLHMWRQYGYTGDAILFGQSEAMQLATRSYLYTTDSFNGWLMETVGSIDEKDVVEQFNNVNTIEVYNSYKDYCDSCGHIPKSNCKLSRLMHSLYNLKTVSNTGARRYKHID